MNITQCTIKLAMSRVGYNLGPRNESCRFVDSEARLITHRLELTKQSNNFRAMEYGEYLIASELAPSGFVVLSYDNRWHNQWELHEHRTWSEHAGGIFSGDKIATFNLGRDVSELELEKVVTEWLEQNTQIHWATSLNSKGRYCYSLHNPDNSCIINTNCWDCIQECSFKRVCVLVQYNDDGTYLSHKRIDDRREVLQYCKEHNELAKTPSIY